MDPKEPTETRRPPVAPGDRVGHFEILEMISHGGMGVVFKARDLDLPRDVALKCPWPELARDKEIRGRFHREGRIDSQLAHPNIVRLYEVFEDRNLPWLAMEFVEGGSLSAMIDHDGKLEINRAIPTLISLPPREHRRGRPADGERDVTLVSPGYVLGSVHPPPRRVALRGGAGDAAHPQFGFGIKGFNMSLKGEWELYCDKLGTDEDSTAFGIPLGLNDPPVTRSVFDFGATVGF